jgi:hypothetical protein
MQKPIHKGVFYYELSLLMFVIMWKHDLTYQPIFKPKGLTIGRLHIWINDYWFYAVRTRFRLKGKSLILPFLIWLNDIKTTIYIIKRVLNVRSKYPLSFFAYTQSFEAFCRLYDNGLNLRMVEKEIPFPLTYYKISFRDNIIYEVVNPKNTEKFTPMSLYQ